MPNAAIETTEHRENGDLSREAAHLLEQNYRRIEANGVHLYVDDRKDVRLPEGAQRVYPFIDESTDLLALAQRVVEERGGNFARVIDCVAGGGNSMLPVLKAGIAKRGFGIDLNPRAVNLAQHNASLNGMADRATFTIENINNLDATLLESDEPTLFMANPPFALSIKGQWGTDLPGNRPEERLMREGGGKDGLNLTRAYVTQTLAKAFTEHTLEHAKPGDAIIGLAYSRIGTDGHIELESVLKDIVGNRGAYTVELVKGATLWRGPNGKKEQPNPMPLTSMRIKGTTPEQMADYDRAAASHLAEGYDQMGYFRYVIRVGSAEVGREETRRAAQNLLIQE